ncbi:molybdenum cofactor biosynthesis protein MoaE [Flaviflexus massiliensis]|uniref:molybdenum cofactor biosynthesis protein MoaE n=1 Tax=Flaviflexus massiliensis TaxID=1522309 RepID=UPI00097DDEE1|nr:molybdenum cofactor biosynthesis protein MoaE [Flaviflexus massiliensis]
MIHAHVITVSDRCSRGEREDLSGPLAAALLGGWSINVSDTKIVPDGADSVTSAITQSVNEGARVIVTTGGTGISPRDETPEGTLPLLSKRLDGIESLIRQAAKNAPAAPLSRALAGIVTIDGTDAFVVNAPGSRGGVTDTINVIGPLLDHIVDQLDGGDHPVPHVAHDHGGHVSALDIPAAHHHGAKVTPHAEATYRTQHSSPHPTHDADVVYATVTEEPIDMEHLVDLVERPEAGAVLTFKGVVRNHDGGRSVNSIDYEAHPDADKVVARVAHQVAKNSGCLAVAVVHRSGHLEIGDIALGAAVSAAHRVEAFAVLNEVVEQVKLQLPVWKKQQFPDGTHEWTGSA